MDLSNLRAPLETLTERNTENLFTAALAISASPSETPSDKMSLGRAAFWVHLRQDIHIALLLHVPIDTNYPPCLHRDRVLENLDHLTGSAENGANVRPELINCAWANRMALLLVDVITYSFQDRKPGDFQLWMNLRQRLDRWNLAKPSGFRPYYEQPPDPSAGRWFPEIWVSSDCYVLALLYYHTATILLKTYPPCSSTESGTTLENMKGPVVNGFENREEVLIHARALCGIAMTNPNAQALIVVCHMVLISAIFFKEEGERKETIHMIQMAHSATGHPIHAVEQSLRKGWEMGVTGR